MSKKVLNLAASFDVTKADEDDSLVIEGYANTTDKDRAGDVVLQEAWNKGGMDNYLQNPIILGFHKHDNPIGKMDAHTVNSKGLFISATISKAAGKVYDLIKDGILRTFSIGFRVLDADYNSDTDIFVIKDLELLEVSVVSIPANQYSIFNVRKDFDSEDEFNQFKQEFTSQEEVVPNIPEEEEDMPTPEEIKALEEKAVAKYKAAEEAKEAEEQRLKDLAIAVGETESEKLMKAVEDKLAEKDASIQEALDAVVSLKSELGEKTDEINAMVNSRMHFSDNGRKGKDNTKAQDEAVLLSKILGKTVDGTEFGKKIITKSDATHQDNMTEDWEQEFSTRILEDMEQQLIIEPLFTNNIAMPTVTVNMPVNPAAGYAQWILPAAFATADSTGADENHQLGDFSLTAHKLASKDRVSYEEEEDLIVPFLGIIRNAVVERMAKASDRALLVGDVDDATPSNATFANVYPFDGLATYAIEDSAVDTGTAITTALEMQGLRRYMGKYGLNPSELVYVVNTDAYYDLLEDDEFRTLDLVGGVATALRGQVGSINGIRVIVSAEFETEASGTARAICVNMRNYVKGTLRGIMVERDRDIEQQTNIIVATRRMGMKELFAAQGTPGSGGHASCAALTVA